MLCRYGRDLKQLNKKQKTASALFSIFKCLNEFPSVLWRIIIKNETLGRSIGKDGSPGANIETTHREFKLKM